ncbi:MAG: KOW domain-containing RNA-binding protein [Bacillota bacterium]|nr:KOW domain-containing RNA-binding protein [Bacillota bacterium]
MNGGEIRPWQLVASSAGRDSGQRYLVLTLCGDGFALVVDGQRRRVDRPKRKNLRHLRPLAAAAADLAERTAAGQAVSDEQVRASLDALSAQLAPEPEPENDAAGQRDPRRDGQE